MIRNSRPTDSPAILSVINAAAQVYRSAIPPDLWREPYMPREELQDEIAHGVTFWVAEEDGCLSGVMGLQDKSEVTLVRHAYVSPDVQRKGVGTRLLHHLQGLTGKPVLIGTWAAASWAIAFYEKNGFAVVSSSDKDSLLRKYWSITPRHAEASVVLADRRWMKSRKY